MVPDLPVWTIRPNWKDGILERLSWQTDVIASDSGAEQRRSIRYSPRRAFEFTVNPTDAERTFLDLTMHRLGAVEWLMPLWHDQGKLSEPAVVDAQAIIFDNTFREHADGGFALLYRDTFTWEVVEIQTSWDGGLLLVGDVQADWPRGTKVFPLRRVMTAGDTSIAALTSRVGQSVLLWEINEANDFPENMQTDHVFEGAPIITQAPNRANDLTRDLVRLFTDRDNQIGLKHRVDPLGRAFAKQSHNWQVHGREAQHSFREMLYWMRGRQRAVWLPSFNDDLKLTRPRAIGATSVYVAQAGFAYVGAGGPIPGRSTFWTGKEVVRQAAILAAPGGAEERLGLLAPTTAAYLAGASWAFLEPARLDSDIVELHHHTDSDGTFECGVAFATFANSREAAMPIYYPIPAGVMGSMPCGEQSDQNPCDSKECPTYPVRFAFTMPEMCNPNYGPTTNLVYPDVRKADGGTALEPNYQLFPGGPAGKRPPSLNNVQGVFSFYEENWYNDPNHIGYHNPDYVRFQGQVLMDVDKGNDHLFVTFHYPLDGHWYFTVQYPAFFCGSVGKDSGLLRLQMCRTGGMFPFCSCDMTNVIPDQVIGGNAVYNYDWEF